MTQKTVEKNEGRIIPSGATSAQVEAMFEYGYEIRIPFRFDGLSSGDEIISGDARNGFIRLHESDCVVVVDGWAVYFDLAQVACERFIRRNKIAFASPDASTQIEAATPQLETHHTFNHTNAGKITMPAIQPQTDELKKARAACMAVVAKHGLSNDSQTMLGAAFGYFTTLDPHHQWHAGTRKAWTPQQWRMVRDAVEGGVWIAGPNGEWRRSFGRKAVAA